MSILKKILTEILESAGVFRLFLTLNAKFKNDVLQ
jgi:hypothetical protein